MNLAPVDAMEFDCALVEPALMKLSGDGPLTLEMLAGGRNSRVYRVNRGGGEAYVAKVYYNPDRPEDRGVSGGAPSYSRPNPTQIASIPDQPRDRRGCEFAALRFLWDSGVRCIPEPIATFPEQGLSILRWVDGNPVAPHDLSSPDVDALVAFLAQIDSLKHRPESPALAAASEACFSLESLACNVHERFSRLRVVADEGETQASRQLGSLLTQDMSPLLERALALAEKGFAAHGLEVQTELPIASRTLSPSDFGFHNALRRPDGTLTFVDFEHFGWDDPAKMVSDFLLHPAFSISPAHRRQFMHRMMSTHPACDPLRWRVPLIFPLYALKWCTILLNEFVPEHQCRRTFALPLARTQEKVLLEQLAKARSMFAVATQAQERFPYAA